MFCTWGRLSVFVLDIISRRNRLPGLVLGIAVGQLVVAASTIEPWHVECAWRCNDIVADIKVTTTRTSNPPAPQVHQERAPAASPVVAPGQGMFASATFDMLSTKLGGLVHAEGQFPPASLDRLL